VNYFWIALVPVTILVIFAVDRWKQYVGRTLITQHVESRGGQIDDIRLVRGVMHGAIHSEFEVVYVDSEDRRTWLSVFTGGPRSTGETSGRCSCGAKRRVWPCLSDA